jgi:hypothetical protein
MKSLEFRVAQNVSWKWLGRVINGTIQEIYFNSITQEIKGKRITRHGSKENPAYLVKSEAGNFALKLKSELQAPHKNKLTPKIFQK